MNGKMLVIVLLVVSQVLDLVTTYIGFGCGLREGNVIPSFAIAAGGPFSLVFLKMIAIACLLGIALLCQRRYPKLWRGVAAASVITMLAVASNAVSIVLAMG